MSHPMDQRRLFVRDKDLHGSAKWADFAHHARYGQTSPGGDFWGYGLPERDGQGAYPLYSNTLRHYLTFGPTRSNKLIATSIPRCLEHKGQIVCIDSKNGEVAKIIAPIREKITGRRAVIVDSWEKATSFLGRDADRFNIFDTYDPESDSFYEDVLLDAYSLVTPRNTKDPHWEDEGRSLIAGLKQHITTCPEFLFPTDDKSRSLGQLRDLLNLPPKAFKAMVAGEFSEAEDGKKTLVRPGMAQSRNKQVRGAAARILNKAEREFSGVMSTAHQNTHFLESEKIRSSMSCSTFTMEEFENGEIDIYIVLPAGSLWLYSQYLRLLLAKLIRAVTKFKSKPRNPILFFVEEAAALGRLEILQQAFSLLAGFGIQLHLIFQDLSQLASLYKDNWQSFIANSGVIQLLATTDPFTAEYFSKYCGNTSSETLSYESMEKRAGIFTPPDFFTRGDSVNSRNLITPQEVMTLPPGMQLLFFANQPPTRAYMTAYFLDRRYRDKKDNPIYSIDPNYSHLPTPASIEFTKPGLNIEAVFHELQMRS
ncbi:MAG: hypothetical protein NPIRA05_09670 [Nitrospirales bacterium]|nr:MAG: hypothetical protein NPIRA05_09670 [Nitrospirales bacterium]